MGWVFGYSNRRELLDDLRCDRRYGDQNQLLKSCVRGNVLWSVVAVKRNGETELTNYIGVDLMQNGGKEHGWGYKDMGEGCHPYQYSCPLSYLDLVPIVRSQAWRDGVRGWHAKQSRKFAIGERVGLTHCKIPCVTISQLRPLIGHHDGVYYRVPRQRVLPGSYSSQLDTSSASGGAYA